MCPTSDEYYFNTLTGEVEHGRGSSWTHRMGPYPTREAAEMALVTAKQRSSSWEDADSQWGDEGDGDDD